MTQHAHALWQLFGQPASRLMPVGVRFGKTILAPNVLGVDAESGELVDGLEAQMEHALARLCDVLDEAGAAAANVARATAYVGSTADREPVYGPWDRLFPNAADRPAFKVLVAPLPDGVRVRLDAVAVAGAQRRRIDIAGVSARDPTVCIGSWMATSRVHGTDPSSGEVSTDLATETRQAFENIATLLLQAGATPEDLSQLLVFVRDAADARQVQETVRQVFQGLHSGQVQVLTNFVPKQMRLMVEATAAKGGDAFREVFARAGASPIPDASVVGKLLFAPALEGEGSDFESQLRSALDRMQATLRQANLGLSHVGQVSVYMRDLEWKPTLNRVWSELYPLPDDRPPHKYVPLEGDDPRQLVLVQVLAVAGAQRRVLEIPGMAHGDPMSMGARLDDLVFSSRIVGTDTNTGATPADRNTQSRLALRNVRTLLEQAGTNLGSLSQANAYINDAEGRALTLGAWREVFSGDGADQPKLHFLEARLPGLTVVRFEVFATC